MEVSIFDTYAGYELSEATTDV